MSKMKFIRYNKKAGNNIHTKGDIHGTHKKDKNRY